MPVSLPSAIVRTTVVIVVTTSLLLVTAVGVGTSGQVPTKSPEVERPTRDIGFATDRSVPQRAGQATVLFDDVTRRSPTRASGPADLPPNVDPNPGTDALDNATLELAQEDRQSPTDSTPDGIETVYGSPNVVATAGGAGVDVAILDSGIDRDHPDLKDQVEVCRDYSGQGVSRNRCQDLDGHGTHVAGTIAAMGGENGSGLYGVAPAVDIWAFKVCSNGGSCNSDDVAQAIEDAGSEGAEVIVLSIGGERTPAVERAINGAQDRGALLVAAAGNAGPELETIEHPASDPAVVAVGAVERTSDGPIRPEYYRVPGFSSRGVNASTFSRQPGHLEVAAPGVGVVSTWTGGSYHALSGTSVAVPHVAGVAARVWSATEDRNDNGRVNDDVRRVLRNRAASFDITRGTHARRGYDPASGLGLPRIVTPQVTISTTPPTPTIGESVILVADRVGGGSTSITDYRWDLTADGTVDALGSRIETRFETAGPRTVRLRTIDEDGVIFETEVDIRVNAPPIADFTYAPDVPLAGEEIRFTAIGSGDPDGRIQTYAWDVDGDGGADATGPTATATFDEPGRHPVTLSVFDDVGATSTTTHEVLVNDRPRIEVPETVHTTADERVSLQATVTDVVGATSVTWYFPNGRTAMGPEVQETFPPGRHSVRVVVQDEYGASDEAILTVVAEEGTTEPHSPTPTATATDGPATGLPLHGFTPTTVGVALLIGIGLVAVGNRIRDPPH